MASTRGFAKKAAILGVALLFVVGGVLYSMSARGGDKGPTYATETVSRGKVASTVTATGSITPRVTVEVGSQVSGRIRELNADFNSEVEEGQVVARLDPRLFETDVARARASTQSAAAAVRRAEAEREDARRRHRRASSLASQDLIAQSEADTATAQLESAEAQVESARAGLAQSRAALDQAETNLAYTTVVSPISGTVISRDVDVGQTVAASLQAPTLFTIAEDLRFMEVHTNVAEADVGRIRDGMTVTFTVDAWPGESFEGEVKEVRFAPETVQNVVTYNAVVSVENPDGKLRPGMTADATFIVEEREDTVIISNSALRFRPSQEILDSFEEEMRAAMAPPAGSRATDGAVGTGGKGKGGGRGDGSGRGQMEGDEAREGLGVGRPDPESIRVVWRLTDEGKPEPVRVRTGITDGRSTEVLRGLEPGDLVIVGSAGSATGQSRSSGASGSGMGRFL